MQEFNDYWVKRRSESEIKALANRCRALKNLNNTIYFNIVEFLQSSFRGTKSRERKLLFAIVHDNHPKTLPYVVYKPLTLFVSRSILRQAEIGNSFRRFQLAHETGHIVMHDHYHRSFSNDKSMQIGFDEEEHSAEWQANTFAKYFLLPDWVFYVAKSPDEILERARVPQPRLAGGLCDDVSLSADQGVNQ